MGKSLFVFGHGYSAFALSRRLLPDRWHITGTTRKANDYAAIKAAGIVPLVWPGDDISAALDDASHILISAGPDERGDPVLAGARQALAKRAKGLEWVGYLSTTAVYGDHQGGWVDEDTPLSPATKRGQWRVQAERDWQSLAAETGMPLHIFRLAGIYGPGRGPFSKVRSGTARRIIKQGQVFSRIHVEDIAQVLQASMAAPDPGQIYNLCDDEAAPPEDVIAHAANLLGLPVPKAIKFEDADLSPMARSFYGESKRVANDRIKSKLGIKLIYPTYRHGLSALLANQ